VPRHLLFFQPRVGVASGFLTFSFFSGVRLLALRSTPNLEDEVSEFISLTRSHLRGPLKGYGIVMVVKYSVLNMNFDMEGKKCIQKFGEETCWNMVTWVGGNSVQDV
jgi:hypothetical protein